MPELVIVIGVQGCGKSSWVAQHLTDTHAVVSKDHWPHARHREQRQRRAVHDLLTVGRSVVVDNTNPAPADRAPLIKLGRDHGALLRAVFLDVPLQVCLARNAGRAARARVPVNAVLRTSNRLVPPTRDEGFHLIDVVRG